MKGYFIYILILAVLIGTLYFSFTNQEAGEYRQATLNNISIAIEKIGNFFREVFSFIREKIINYVFLKIENSLDYIFNKIKNKLTGYNISYTRYYEARPKQQ